jgi:Rrf2 family nitric oxide-sensitive transcriptional repressor
MKLTMQTDYALRTLLYLAQRPGRSTIGDIAEFYRISAHHMGKVAHALGKLGLIRNIRGPGGGLELARPAGSITIGAVIRAFEGTTRMLECVDTPGVCVIQPGCGLRLALAEAERRQMDYLDGISIGSLVARAEEPVMLS